MAKTLHHTVVPLRGNERSILDRSETTLQIVNAPSIETCDWLREVHRAFCGEHTRTMAQRDCPAAIAAHCEAAAYLLELFYKICLVDHPSEQNPEIIQPLSMRCFVAGKSTGPASPAALRWNDSLPRQVEK